MTKIKYVAEIKLIVVDNHNRKHYKEYDQLYVTDKLDKFVNYVEQKLGIKLQKN